MSTGPPKLAFVTLTGSKTQLRPVQVAITMLSPCGVQTSQVAVVLLALFFMSVSSISPYEASAVGPSGLFNMVLPGTFFAFCCSSFFTRMPCSAPENYSPKFAPSRNACLPGNSLDSICVKQRLHPVSIIWACRLVRLHRLPEAKRAVVHRSILSRTKVSMAHRPWPPSSTHHPPSPGLASSVHSKALRDSEPNDSCSRNSSQCGAHCPKSKKAKICSLIR